MYGRRIEARVREALTDTPVVVLVGPRRAGKTTLARTVGLDGRRYLTLDDQTTLDAARADPTGFIRDVDRAIIDEVQRVPELLLAIKRSVDEDYRAGRFLLTGSANLSTLPRVSDSLAGRIETINVLPLARTEVLGRASTFLQRVFDGKLEAGADVVLGDALIELVLTGGFPEAIARTTARRRRAWSQQYLTSVLGQDLRDIAQIERLTELPRFVRLLAEHAAQLINFSEAGTAIGVSYKTAQRYVGLLEQIFLIARLEPWYTNTISRIIKSPKLHFLDSGVLAATRGLTLDRVRANRALFGCLLESFVFAEVVKLATWSDMQVTPYHFRDQRQHEVDLVLDRDDGQIVGIEVKASATVTSADFRGLRKLAEAAGTRFASGVVLYDGDTLVRFGDGLVAAPISCLWS